MKNRRPCELLLIDGDTLVPFHVEAVHSRDKIGNKLGLVLIFQLAFQDDADVGPALKAVWNMFSVY